MYNIRGCDFVVEKKYYDKWQFDQAFNLIETNPHEAKNRFEEYLKQYPDDYATYPYYAYVLITIGEFEQAEKILNYVEKKYIHDSKFLTIVKKVDLLKQNIPCSYGFFKYSVLQNGTGFGK